MSEPEDFEGSSQTSASMKTTFYDAFRKVLSANIPEGQPAILFKYKTPEKRIAEEQKHYNELQARKVKKRKEQEKAHTKETDYDYERQLRATALKGVVKVFNEISKAQRSAKKVESDAAKFKNSMRFRRRMETLEGKLVSSRKLLKYDSVQPPKWDIFREDYLTQAK
mmetsp:Transcript_23313/g.41422  ORF Transcript_23313/g.41422 Transcript_23313/m.41422 type:complete len:167 (-) Transcript_23313:16-516(-)|eukprot:CAMPEP_0204907606 /NCGR_PEP_ID=MMETSP1397-20131031/6723_1 /ASSEMBLY_ACC=CAM_ASM_000891 /TAXON_ID=49980 /ORGANISM="Climacostomum Climacostomum virens, Strain Stock W-24" /LENGTH=166 /DNA_ID=CAMNT_0052076827 /DNA_START=6 /DNA_END=506 /DNA_ORIENTATION=+